MLKQNYPFVVYPDGGNHASIGKVGEYVMNRESHEIGKQLQIIENITSSLKNDANAFWDITPACRNIPSILNCNPISPFFSAYAEVCHLMSKI